MTILDANILLYAYNPDAPQHPAARAWLDELFRGVDPIGFSWPAVWAFLRISTNPRVRPHVTAVPDAFQRVRDWLSQPGVVLLHPGPRHIEILERLVIEGQAAGRRLSDAALAALALEHGATLASTDRDFARFPNLRWVNPLS